MQQEKREKQEKRKRERGNGDRGELGRPARCTAAASWPDQDADLNASHVIAMC